MSNTDQENEVEKIKQETKDLTKQQLNQQKPSKHGILQAIAWWGISEGLKYTVFIIMCSLLWEWFILPATNIPVPQAGHFVVGIMFWSAMTYSQNSISTFLQDSLVVSYSSIENRVNSYYLPANFIKVIHYVGVTLVGYAIHLTL